MTTATVQAKNVLREIQESVKDRPNRDLEFSTAALPGEYIRQGDVYITLLEKIPSDATLIKEMDSQLAPGSTRGSRHILDNLIGVKMYSVPNPTVLDGPILDITETRVITHPDHGHITCPPGIYGISFQRQHAEELKRARD